MTPSKTHLVLLVSSAFALNVFVGLPARAQASFWVQSNAAARASFENGDFSGAEQGWLEALRLAREIGPSDPRVAETLSELGSLYQKMERYEESVATLRGALRIKQSLYGPDSPELKDDLTAYGTSLRLLGEDELADAAALRRERILLLHPSAVRKTVAKVETTDNKAFAEKKDANNDASVAHDTSNPHDAMTQALAQLKQRDRTGSSESAAVASVGRAIQDLTKTGDPASAEQGANEALSELQKYKGLENTEVAYVLSLRAAALRVQGKGSAALDDATRANNIYANVTSSVESSEFQTATVTRTRRIAHAFESATPIRDDSIAWRNKIISASLAEDATIKQIEQSELQSLAARERAALMNSRRYRLWFVR